MNKKEYNYWFVLIISILFGWLGIDRFITGHTKLGIVKLCTFGACGIWWLIDIIMYACKLDATIEYTTSENSKKVGLGIISILIILTLISLATGGPGSKTTPTINEVEHEDVSGLKTPIETKEAIVTKKPEEAKKPTEKPTIDVDNIKLTIELAAITLEKSYDGIAKVSIEHNLNIIEIEPIDGFNYMLGVEQASKGEQPYLGTWNSTVDSIIEISLLVEEDITISIVNPLNPDNSILLVNNGMVLYNYVDANKT